MIVVSSASSCGSSHITSQTTSVNPFMVFLSCKTRGGMAAASLTWLWLLLRGGKRLAVIHETDDLVTSSNVDVQVGSAIPIAIFKRQRNRYQILPCPKQTRP